RQDSESCTARRPGAEMSALGRQAGIERDLEVRGPARHAHAERVHVARVASPGQRRIVRADRESDDRLERPARSVLARNPFRKHQRERTLLHGQCQIGMHALARDLARIDAYLKIRGLPHCAREHERREQRAVEPCGSHHSDLRTDTKSARLSTEWLRRATSGTVAPWARRSEEHTSELQSLAY